MFSFYTQVSEEYQCLNNWAKRLCWCMFCRSIQEWGTAGNARESNVLLVNDGLHETAAHARFRHDRELETQFLSSTKF
jgi:hypothetical protein